MSKHPTLLDITRKTYPEQAKWYLNAFWKTGGEENAEKVWGFAQEFIKLDDKKKAGNELDEFWSHKFLESQEETLTVLELREKLAKIDQDKNKKMALLEYLLFKYSKSVKECLEAPQDEKQQEINEASEKLSVVSESLAQLQKELEAQTLALAEQKKAEEQAQKDLKTSTNAAIKAKADSDAAHKAESEANLQLVNQKKAEELVKAAESALKIAVQELRDQEDAYHNQIKILENRSNDENLGDVKRKQSINELAQLKEQDPLPLRKAKITQEAALKKVERERKAAEAVTAKAQASHEAAEKAARDAEASAAKAEQAKQEAEASAAQAQKRREEKEEQAQKVEKAVKETEELAQEAQRFLEELKKKSQVARGAIWWMERELKETQKYLPKKKQTAV